MPRVLRYPRDLHLFDRLRIGMAMVDSLPKFLVSCAKEPYKNGALVQKKNLGSLTIVATPYLPILSLKLTRYTTQFSSSLPTAGRKYVSFPAQCYV